MVPFRCWWITLWSPVKIRLRYWWWIVKYGGKKRIPSDVVFGALSQSMSRMTEHLESAQLLMPDDMDAEERQRFYATMERTQELERAINRMQWEREHGKPQEE